MRPWVLLESARVPDGGDLRLYERDGELAIHVDGRVLMTSRVHGSEETLASAACEPIRARPNARVLIGGLGMGFTLAAALGHVSKTAQVIVAEVVPAVVKWNRGPLGRLAGHPLSDSRVSVREQDVARVIKSDRLGGFDAILLDVDNGPNGLTRPANEWLYGTRGLAAAKVALRPGGVLGVWSAQPDRAFESCLRGTGLTVKTLHVHAHGDRGRRHTIWIATADPARGAPRPSTDPTRPARSPTERGAARPAAERGAAPERGAARPAAERARQPVRPAQRHRR